MQRSRIIPIDHQPPIRKVLYPLTAFLHTESAGGILLIFCAVIALVWANSPWADTYTALWAIKVTVGPLTESLLHWINDGLMAIFFFVVGLEIKREVLVGELASPRQAALPIAAAIGGMVVPALLYIVINAGGAGGAGWGIPMATDIAFSLGVLALLGSRVPTSLKIFLAALAIVDDLGAVLVIALFYTTNISWTALSVGIGLICILIAANLLRARHPLLYALLGTGLWIAFLQSGIHATIAGVILALTIPARTRVDTGEFLQRAEAALQEFDNAGDEAPNILTNGGQQAALRELADLSEGVQTPLQRLEHALHPWVAFLIVPLFALANAGVALTTGLRETIAEPVTIGVFIGLLFGKQIGVMLSAWVVTKLGFAELPEGVRWSHLYGVGWLAGIGFTMSLFIGSLAFGAGPLLDAAKVGILAASFIAGIVGWTILRLLSSNT